MYTPPAFRVEDLADIHTALRASGIANLVTATAQGLMATPLPFLFDATEGPHGVLYGHLARANPQWSAPVIGEALVIFMGPDAYVTPSWYETKKETGKVVPTWNYETIHVYGEPEFFEDAARLHELVNRLTDHHEGERASPWKVDDAPADFVAAQLRGIVGLRIPVSRVEAKRKMSQNRSAADRKGVRTGMAAEAEAKTRHVATLIPE